MTTTDLLIVPVSFACELLPSKPDLQIIKTYTES